MTNGNSGFWILTPEYFIYNCSTGHDIRSENAGIFRWQMDKLANLAIAKTFACCLLSQEDFFSKHYLSGKTSGKKVTLLTLLNIH
ncbi:MAG: hypothetical protein WBA93_34540 [Microcoleaceae cyanobacterium]